MAEYEIWLTTDTGQRIADRGGRTLLSTVLWLSYTRTANAPGAISLGLMPTFDTRLIVPDRMVQVWRAPAGGRLRLFRTYLIRKWRYHTTGSVEFLTLFGPDVNDLLRRRVVAYAAGSSQAGKTDYADDMMKAVFDENFVNDASSPTYGSRDLSVLSVQGDLSDGPTLTRSFAWRRVLRVLQDLAEASKTAGTNLYFDVVESDVGGDSLSLEFRTYTGQPGRDLTDLGAVFDQERGNLADPFLEYDYMDEENYIYALGQGEGDDREVQEVYDADRHDASILARCEGPVNANNEEPVNGVREAGRARLEEKRPVRRMGGEIVDIEGFRFGRDWNWGDRAIARYRGIDWEAVIRSVQVFVNGDGEETVRARLEYAA